MYWADLSVPFGSEPGFRRPALIVQDNAFNRSRIRTVLVLPLSTNILLADAPGNVLLEKAASAFSKDSVVVVSQLTALDRERLIERIDRLDAETMSLVDEGLRLVLGLRWRAAKSLSAARVC